jgi:hypothetical protein
MYLLLLTARLLHILLGVFWAGALIFNALFLFPAMRDAGPDGAKVGAALMRRGFLNVLPPAAGLTVLSGLWLLWFDSGRFSPGYMGSRPGIAYSVGALTAIIALGLGVGIMRPSMLKAAALAQAAASAPAAERDASTAAALALRTRAGTAGAIVAALLALTAAMMAIGRYA